FAAGKKYRDRGETANQENRARTTSGTRRLDNVTTCFGSHKALSCLLAATGSPDLCRVARTLGCGESAVFSQPAIVADLYLPPQSALPAINFLLRHNSFAFAHGYQPVGWDSSKDLVNTTQPFYFYPLDLLDPPEAEVQAQITLRAEASSTAHFLNLAAACRFNNDP